MLMDVVQRETLSICCVSVARYDGEASWHSSSRNRSPVSPPRMELYDEKLLLRGDVPPPDVWPQIVQPSKPAALARPLQT